MESPQILALSCLRVSDAASSGFIANNSASAIRTFDGQIDDVRVYNRVVSEGEIKKLATPPPDLENGLIGHWTLDDGTGSTAAADSSGNGNDGTLTNFPADPSASWMTGRVGGALAFDGADDYVNVGNDASLNNVNALTYTAWIYPRSSGESSNGNILSKLMAGDSTKTLRFGGGGTAQLNFFVSRSTDAEVTTFPNAVTMNAWNFVAATYTSTDGPRLYIAKPGQAVSEASYGVRNVGAGAEDDDSSVPFLIGSITTSGDRPSTASSTMSASITAS